ncbi:hypothetical protein [Luteimonas saliphila]|uniref:hypothetical protein n=1 Tax=Luteimonas saliphila TaxID=2804919 RepID=UPI00192DBC45|nr:hypothetical protein [Luteimonas saliphila]
MTDLDDHSLLLAEVRAGRRAIDIVQELFPFQPTAKPDEVGILRLGHGRPIQRRPVSTATALHWLKSDMVHVQQVLRGRVFELLALHPEASDRLPYLYAVGDLLDAETLRDANPLWDAMRKGDWRTAATELMACQWDRYYGSTAEKRRAVIGLVMAIAAPDTAH